MSGSRPDAGLKSKEDVVVEADQANSGEISTDLLAGPAPADPVLAFQAWFSEAETHEINDPNAMALATVATDGRPSLRMVLMKGYDRRGPVFYTNLGSRKGRELADNPRASVLFHWKSLRRQVRIEGRVEPVTPQEADDYFGSRARGSRVGAWASDQSRLLPHRSVLEERVREMEYRYPGENIPRPSYWSGFRLLAEYYEFWQDRRSRLHDRLIYRRVAESASHKDLNEAGSVGVGSANQIWGTERLYP